jgi:hypothetical protein
MGHPVKRGFLAGMNIHHPDAGGGDQLRLIRAEVENDVISVVGKYL